MSFHVIADDNHQLMTAFIAVFWLDSSCSTAIWAFHPLPSTVPTIWTSFTIATS
jgi:hypothetical protein